MRADVLNRREQNGRPRWVEVRGGVPGQMGAVLEPQIPLVWKAFAFLSLPSLLRKNNSNHILTQSNLKSSENPVQNQRCSLAQSQSHLLVPNLIFKIKTPLTRLKIVHNPKCSER